LIERHRLPADSRFGRWLFRPFRSKQRERAKLIMRTFGRRIAIQSIGPDAFNVEVGHQLVDA
jgi:hypothetical protein